MTDQVCVVTGGGGPAIGKGLSAAIAESGFIIWVADRDLDTATSVADEIGDRAQAVELDVSDASSVAQAFEKVLAGSGRIDGLVNSAGVGLQAAAHEVTEEEFDRVVGTDLKGAWLCCRAAIPAMISQGGGSIVNIGSVHANATAPLYSIYSAAKAGLAGLTRGIAMDYGDKGIRCNIVHPGLVDGPQTRETLKAGGHEPEEWMRQFVAKSQALDRLISPMDVGRAVAFLLGEGAAAITATELTVDGGVVSRLFT